MQKENTSLKCKHPLIEGQRYLRLGEEAGGVSRMREVSFGPVRRGILAVGHLYGDRGKLTHSTRPVPFLLRWPLARKIQPFIDAISNVHVFGCFHFGTSNSSYSHCAILDFLEAIFLVEINPSFV
jgi:hypothetical protein